MIEKMHVRCNYSGMDARSRGHSHTYASMPSTARDRLSNLVLKAENPAQMEGSKIWPSVAASSQLRSTPLTRTMSEFSAPGTQ